MLLNILYHVFIVGFHCKDCVLKRERESMKTQATKDWRDFTGSSRLSIPRKEACALHMTRMRRVKLDGDSCVSRVSREDLASKAFPRDTRDTFCSASLFSLIHTCCAYTIYTHITHKCWGELLRENPSQITWELEIVIPTILHTFVLGIFSSPTSPFPYHWEVDSPNTYHTLWECQVIIWCCWEALKEAKDGRCNRELVARSGELDKTQFWVALLE